MPEIKTNKERLKEITDGIEQGIKELFELVPYVVTLIVLIIVSLRKKRENLPPASLGLSYFREER